MKLFQITNPDNRTDRRFHTCEPKNHSFIEKELDDKVVFENIESLLNLCSFEDEYDVDDKYTEIPIQYMKAGNELTVNWQSRHEDSNLSRYSVSNISHLITELEYVVKDYCGDKENEIMSQWDNFFMIL